MFHTILKTKLLLDDALLDFERKDAKSQKLQSLKQIVDLTIDKSFAYTDINQNIRNDPTLCLLTTLITKKEQTIRSSGSCHFYHTSFN